jgi:large repetitive protein
VNGLSSEPVSVTVPADSSNIPPTPAIGGIIDHVGPVQGKVAPGGSADDPKPTFTGRGAKPGDIITIKDGSTPIGSAIVKPDGTWSVTPDTALGNGPHTIGRRQ